MSEHTHQHKRHELRALILALYRVTDRIPAGEILRTKLREEALEAVAASERFFHSSDERDYHALAASLKTLAHFCDIAQKQLWVDERNFAVLSQSIMQFYRTIPHNGHIPGNLPVAAAPAKVFHSRPDIVEKKQSASPRKKPERAPSTKKLSGRQEKIFEHLKKSGKAQVGDISPLFPKLSKRTIRRDLDGLVSLRVVTRSGRTNGTLYQLIRTTQV